MKPGEGGADGHGAGEEQLPLLHGGGGGGSSSGSASGRERAARSAAAAAAAAAAVAVAPGPVVIDTEESPDEADPDNPLISPCMCSGSSRFVHRACLAQWRASSHRADAFYQCEVCKFRYQYSRAWWASLLGSRVTLGVVFAASLALLVFLLGFIPLLGPPSAPWGPVATHIACGVVALGILGLVAGCLLLMARACGAGVVLWMPDPWCPAALCIDCQGGGVPLCMEVSTAGECGVAMGALLGVALLVLGVLASALLTWNLLLAASGAALSRAQRMVENIVCSG
ncbi:MAG: hypothetical protein J3K34DRAFT_472826 [Monoraphidium minutum]|nr:MAG: hypothetical protein J3K34DRAFT_472826 [Monoraphidium minutum]